MSRILGINGSPRNNGNTATLLRRALDGAESKGAQTELIHLYDLDFKGCISCFACKRAGIERPTRCVVKDELSSILTKFDDTDAIIIGSPIYIGDFTSSTRAFIERLTFPNVSYEKESHTYFTRKMSVGIICTMGAPHERIKEAGFDKAPEVLENVLKRVFGSAETIISADTTQFDDYSKYAASRFDPAHKKKVREEHFDDDLTKAFGMGARFADNAI